VHAWWDWYAAYFVARTHGHPTDEAVRRADRHMADAKGVALVAS
jgi:hypothetical protein